MITLLTPTLTEDKAEAKSYLTTNYFTSSGGTSMYTAINSAFSLFQSNDDTVLKMMVVLSDGETSGTGYHSSVIITAKNNDVKIYTVGLGTSSSSYFTNYLKPLANETGGAFYLASDASKLEEIYNDVSDKIYIETDSDGLSDKLEIDEWFDPLKKDADRDGRPDRIEYEEGTSPYEYDKEWNEYLVEIIDAFGNINIDKMHKIRLAIQKGTFSSEDISSISKRMSELGITKEYETVMKKIDFGTYLKNIVGNPPSDMLNPHAHHILFKTGNGAAQQALVEEGQAILRKYGIDPIF